MIVRSVIDTGKGMEWLDHHLLRQFLVVAEEGQISRAAERLGIEQPPLSRAIHRLEARLGAKLLVRRPRGVELTDAGRIFRDGVKRLLTDASRLVETTRQTERGERGQLMIGVTATTALHPCLQDRLGRFSRAYPNVTLKLQEGQSAQLLEALRAGALDAAFLWTPPAEDLWTYALARERLVAAVPATIPLAVPNGPIRIATLADATFIVYGRRDGFGLFAATVAACHRAGFAPRFGLEAPRLGAALGMVALGMGIVLLPQTLRIIAHPGVRFVDLSGGDEFSTTLRLVTPLRTSVESAAMFRQFIASEPPLDAA